MNDNQKVVAVFVSIILIVMLLFPPFAVYPDGEKISTGCHFIVPEGRRTASIDASTLLIEYLIIITVGGILFYTLKDRKKRG